MTVTDAQLAAAEQAYLEARDRRDRATIAEAQGKIRPSLRTDAAMAAAAARTALAAVVVDPAWPPDDLHAYRVMAQWTTRSAETQASDNDADRAYVTGESWGVTAERGFAALSTRIADEYAQAQGAVDVGDVTLTRLGVLDRLGNEANPERRRQLFHALEPVWQTIDADGGVASPYQRLLPLSVNLWARDGSPVDRSAAALGLSGADVEAHLIAILETWRDGMGANARIEPWDWWYETGAASRALRAAAPVGRIRELSNDYHASLGADPLALGVGFDLFPRLDRPPVPVAYTEFGGRPRILADGARRPARAWIMATYTTGGLGELTELMHESGHAIHLAAIDTRPAFADWPDSDAFTEALAELTALDAAEPSWQAHWLGAGVPESASLRGRYAAVMLDVCWALFEIRLHADPERDPSDVWADLTSTYLDIEPHREVSWWAMRGQLVQEPGYMVNYALAAIIAADLRAAIRAARGDWSTGDPGWYDWVSAQIFCWGLERSGRDVLVDVLGRTPTADALTVEIGRGRAR